jgi:hypothetical protein
VRRDGANVYRIRGKAPIHTEYPRRMSFDSNILSDNGAQSHPTYKLGKLPAKASTKALLFADFVDLAAVAQQVPAASNFWKHRAKFPLGTWGNDQYGDCTRASQAVASMRNERLETNRTISIQPDEVVRVYLDMTKRLYGGGDTGAYEEDALDCWRNPDYTFRDTSGHPNTIDAYTRLDPKSMAQIKAALWLTGGAHGIKVDLNLPVAWQGLVGTDQPLDVHKVNDGETVRVDLTGQWMPGSWGGHSLYSDDYDERGVWVEHTWNLPRQIVTWDAWMAYGDEAHSITDSIDAWRKRKATAELVDLNKLVDAVNQVSTVKLKAA